MEMINEGFACRFEFKGMGNEVSCGMYFGRVYGYEYFACILWDEGNVKPLTVGDRQNAQS